MMLGTVVPPETRVGTDRATGKRIYGWAHAVQSIWDVLMTRLNTRIMLLDYGGDSPGLIDHPGNKQSIATFFSAITTALLKWEPGFRLTNLGIADANTDGAFTLVMTGLFYPRGHLGDYSVVEDVATRFIVAAGENGYVFTGTQTLT